MVREENLKIIAVSFVALAFLSAFVMRVLLESLATYFTWVAILYGYEFIRHGLPVVIGLAVFLSLQLRDSTKLWAHEVVTEIRKVVWPSQKATAAMTFMVCIILLLSGLVLGLFDLVGAAVVDFIIQ